MFGKRKRVFEKRGRNSAAEAAEKRGGSFIALGVFFLCAAVMLSALHIVGTQDRLYYALQAKAGIPVYSGLGEGPLKEIDRRMAGYLKGDRNALDSSPFNDREIRHMEDCYRLFVWLRRAVAGTFFLSALLLGIGIARRNRRPFRYSLRGCAAFALLAGGVGLWGLCDFDSLFDAFHHLLFTNDLWLMDPRTDLMIRICPASMFSGMAAIIGITVFVFIIVWLFLAGIWEEKCSCKAIQNE